MKPESLRGAAPDSLGWRASFWLLWLFTISVSIHDGFWVLANRRAILNDERNPVGRWLLAQNGGDVWFLLAAKAAGTIVAATLLLTLYWRFPDLGWIAGSAVAGLQLVLLLWLYLA
jgi:hypothetical protein